METEFRKKKNHITSTMNVKIKK